MLPLLVAASRGSLIEPTTREKALAASIAIATLPIGDAADAPQVGAPPPATSATVVAAPAGMESLQHEGAEAAAAEEAADREKLLEATEEMVGPVPLRAKGLHTVASLLHSRRPVVMSQLALVVSLCEAQLLHEESYVYQAALNALEAAATARPSEVLPRLAQLILPSTAPSTAALTADRVPRGLQPMPLRSPSDLLRARGQQRAGYAAAPGYYAGESGGGSSGGGGGDDGDGGRGDGGGDGRGDRGGDGCGGDSEANGDDVLDAASERRLKGAQAICQAVRRCPLIAPLAAPLAAPLIATDCSLTARHCRRLPPCAGAAPRRNASGARGRRHGRAAAGGVR